MHSCCRAWLPLVLVLAIGCRQSPYMSAHVQLMNAEKRALEDELYNLEFEYEDALRELEELRQENERLRGGSNSTGRSNSPSRSRTVPRSQELLPPTIDEGTLTEPQIEIPGEPSSSSGAGSPSPSPTTGSPRTVPSGLPPGASLRSSPKKSAAQPVSVGPNATSLEPADPRVTQLFINPLRTGGLNFDREPGDDGISVVVEPRNRDDQFVPLAGPISVLVLDPAKSADQGRIVARWEVAANEAQELLQNTATSRGICLKLQWPGEPPGVSRLQLHVRYITVDNRDLRAERDIYLNLPGQFSQQWTPRAGGPANAAEPAPAPVAEPTQTASPEWSPYR